MVLHIRVAERIKASQQRRKESKVFVSITARRSLQARRQAFEKESIIQAKLEGKRMARTGTKRSPFGGRIGTAGKKAGGKVFSFLDEITRPLPTKRRRRG